MYHCFLKKQLLFLVCAFEPRFFYLFVCLLLLLLFFGFVSLSVCVCVCVCVCVFQIISLLLLHVLI